MASVLIQGFERLNNSIDRVTNSFENFKTQTQSFQGNLNEVSKGLDKVDDQQVQTNKKWKNLNKKLGEDITDFENYQNYYENDFKPNHQWNR